MLPDRVSNPGPLTYESGALLIALRDPASEMKAKIREIIIQYVRFGNLSVIRFISDC